VRDLARYYRRSPKADLLRESHGLGVPSHPMICCVVPFQVTFRCVNRFVDRGSFFGARASNIALVAIPGTPHCIRIGFLHVDRIAHAFSHVIQFLNLFGCHHRYLLSQKLRTEKRACPGTKIRPDTRCLSEENDQIVHSCRRRCHGAASGYVPPHSPGQRRSTPGARDRPGLKIEEAPAKILKRLPELLTDHQLVGFYEAVWHARNPTHTIMIIIKLPIYTGVAQRGVGARAAPRCGSGSLSAACRAGQKQQGSKRPVSEQFQGRTWAIYSWTSRAPGRVLIRIEPTDD
jgi:hypothetical protein